VPRTADGRAVASATIEYRLPDGSAHPHLVLAGIAQAMRDARDRKDLDATIEGARAGRDARARPLPLSFPAVGAELESVRPALEAAEVFPPALLDAVAARLAASLPPP